MNILIIGGTALIGPHLMRKIYGLFPDAKISTVTRTGQNYFAEQALKADRNDREKFEKIVQKVSPDILIDMIPFTVNDAYNTSSIFKRLNPDIPVIALSSIDIYAAYAKLHGTEEIPYQDCPITENMALRTKLGAEGEEYDKLGVEQSYISTFPNLTILRLPAIYGWPDTSRVSDYLDLMLGGKDIEIPAQRANWKFSRCLHKNAAYAILKVIEKNQKGQHVYNVAEEQAYSETEWCKKIGALCGWQGRIILSEKLPNNDFNQNFYVSSKKIRAELGYIERYSPEEGLADTIAFHAYHKMGKPYKKYY